MSGNELERRLAPMDAFFLFGESDEAPMTVGCVAVFDGKIPFRKFVRSIDSRLHLIPRYRQKVVAAPLNIGMPTWEYDPDFDIENHIHEIRLDKPGTEAQFYEKAEGLFEGKLDMERPLWEIYVVQGLEGGVSGLVARVHHAMIDGIAGVGLMMIMFDTVSDPPKIRKKPYRPEPIPDRATLLQDALWDNAIEGVKHWTKFQKSLNRYAKGRSDTQVLDSLKEFGRVFTDLLRPTQRYFFNKVFSGKRRFAFSQYSFSEARAIRRICPGSKLNDVVLTILGGAMGRYLESHDQPTRGMHLQVLVPVNVREDKDDGALGNQITFLPVAVPLDIANPVARLKRVTEITAKLKENRVADSVNLLFNLLQGTPPFLQKLALNAAAAPRAQGLLDMLPQVPPANLICTNVPGPQIPLYTVGRRMVKYHPLLPLALEMGISCGVTSYDQTLYFSFIADGNCAPDIANLRDFHDEEFERLRDAAAVSEREYVTFRSSGAVENGRAKNGHSQNGHARNGHAANGSVKKPASRKRPTRTKKDPSIPTS
ncbi:MAG: wax ester/triacylglycerol synthase family O-acyltransferase [Candidatus Hydrogenedentes bacterium]|nr:wax ester/triacylglycerol synthase family O-acyltransferase [Candidatus Hydrogenedentota bacterium]